ncbi:hypothetical protein DVK85_04340 [Flavobacterium arcticum]|uniref:Uncharacterized protein n=1 Tax=Flavobacterium arcticum TaxID=1784713 RepID=A0A345HA91_9FLAO|nr:hypothetical protein [Flavobacterium arcticum]AXG73501.1 hypothetical protein DVK85_04340 [Flavobacterium arcticum]KAF2513290.1 hypothetical protein E0W72_02390 [Flavobacterium arcticum]
MKKLFLFLSLSILTLSISSCSDDDSNSTDNATSYIKFKVDGVQKNFTNITQEKTFFQSDTYLSIKGQDGNDITETLELYIHMNLNEGANAPYDILNLNYNYAGLEYEANNSSDIVYDTEIYTSERIKGVFTGTLREYLNGEYIYKTITEGNFDIKLNYE